MSAEQAAQSIGQRVYAMTEGEISALSESEHHALATELVEATELAAAKEHADEVRWCEEAQRWLYAVRELDWQRAVRELDEQGE